MTVLRERIGEVLRSQRMQQGRTLRDVSADAQVSLGYICEVERGQKEASSELLESDEQMAAAVTGTLRDVSAVQLPVGRVSASDIVVAA